MMLFRSVRSTDLDGIHHLAEISGIGMTTLPKTKELLQQRIKWGTDSFKKAVQTPADEYYFFVLEDTRDASIAGVSAIESLTGSVSPFYSYKITRRTRVCHSLGIRNDYDVLNLANDYQGYSELCTLFLDPVYRRNNNGLLLSKGRFLFMAQHPERFANAVIAEMRGISDEQGISPFWDNIGAHFFCMPFAKADRLTLATNKQFIADLMPRTSIYIKLLSEAAQKVIGKPHPTTEPAMKLLLREGFRYNNYVDIFDAGPTIEALLSDIKSIAHSRTVSIRNLSDEVSSIRYLVANTSTDFRATIANVLVDKQNATCIVNKETADLLQVGCNDNVCITPLHVEEKTRDFT